MLNFLIERFVGGRKKRVTALTALTASDQRRFEGGLEEK